MQIKSISIEDEDMCTHSWRDGYMIRLGDFWMVSGECRCDPEEKSGCSGKEGK